VKGLGQFGKNFFRIRKEILMDKTTSEIVEYYYLWKKTAAAQSNRFRRRMRPSSVRKISSIASNKAKPSSSINTIKV
jgi:arginine-glutamic acid dipeptide repeat-containing protein